MMRKNPPWMDILHERILESLQENDPATPSLMAATKGIRGCAKEISVRCERLEREEMIRESGKGAYYISEPGLRYLEGELDLTEKPYKTPPRVSERMDQLLLEDMHISDLYENLF